MRRVLTALSRRALMLETELDVLRKEVRVIVYLGVFGALCAAGLGVPVVEEVSIVAAGVLAHRGVMLWWLALACCIAGLLVGDCLLYFGGRRWGARLLRTAPVRRLLSSRGEELAASYRRHGAWIVFGARHAPGLRAAAFLTAGITGVPFSRFLAADAAAVVIGVSTTFTLAYLFMDDIRRLLAMLHHAELWMLIVVVATGGVGIFIALSSPPHLSPPRWRCMTRSSMKTWLSRARMFLVPVVTALVGVTMLTIPWVLPAWRGSGRMAVLAVAGVVELILGGTLAYLVHRDAG